jgi:hypothetical protein
MMCLNEVQVGELLDRYEKEGKTSNQASLQEATVVHLWPGERIDD